jgi:hypothetical protein
VIGDGSRDLALQRCAGDSPSVATAPAALTQQGVPVPTSTRALPGRRPPTRSTALVTLLTLTLFMACSAPKSDDSTATGTAATTPPPAAAVPVTGPPDATAAPATPPRAKWPSKLGVGVVDAALTALSTRDGPALLSLLQRASAACTTARGAGGPPKCPPGVADGTVIEYVPYFECDGWASVDAARNRLIDDSTYPLVVLEWNPPVGSRAVTDLRITHTVLLVREAFGNSGPATSDARLLTALAFDGTALREITADCGAHSQSAFTAGELPRVLLGARVLWRAYPASTAR